MEEVSKETGQRPSVSMPSLDSADDFSTEAISTENSEAVFAATDSFVSTASTDTVITSEQSVSTSEVIPTSSISSISVENTQSVGELSSGALIEEACSEALTEEVPSDSFVDDNCSETLAGDAPREDLIEAAAPEAETLIDPPSNQGGLIEGPASEDLIEATASKSLIDHQAEVLHQESLDESQADEDPSIAIDQFIKKIADEQLSSKRIEEREEEEAQEGGDGKALSLGEGNEATTDDLNNTVEDESKTQLEEAVPEIASDALEASAQGDQNTLPAEPSSLENTLAEEIPSLEEAKGHAESDKPEPMEVDGDIHSAPIQKSGMTEQNIMENGEQNTVEAEEPMQMESIEEIQKEINKIPLKKPTNTEESSKTSEPTSQNEKDSSPSAVNAVDSHTKDESIEKILGDDVDQSTPDVGTILKNVLENHHRAPTIEDSSEVAKDVVLIEKAQEEIKKMDVLVCGECHNTFYYILDFAEHKKGKCPQKSTIAGLCEAENKPQVWGFVLWKVKQTMLYMQDLGGNIPSSWSIYQKWCKLPQADKNAWITAGQSIQFASKIGSAKVTEVRTSKPIKQTVVQKMPGSSPSVEFVDNNKENSSSMDLENSASNIIKKGFTKPVKLNNDVTILPSTKNASINSGQALNTNTAVRTTKVSSAQKDEFVVEKIMAKRFNPRKKTWEYNIKWENFGHDANTWEPITNLSHCKKLLEQFEEQLRRMKEEKAKQVAQSPKGRGRPSNPKPGLSNFVPIAPKIMPTISNVVGGVSDDYAGGSSHRPTRSSKQKAMNQVKQWCGGISDEDNSKSVGLKRKHETDDSDDEDFDEKKIKIEDDSDYSDQEIKPKMAIKKVISTPKQTPIKPMLVKNGNTSQQILPSNILIPDANGVVRINQKQLPALSSGVYIMSKTAGIIKLDSTTSKVATSGGQTIVKVAPKIGQTQIKIVKKDGQTTKQIIQVSPKSQITSTPLKITTTPGSRTSTPKLNTKVRKELKKPTPLAETSLNVMPKKIEIAPPQKPAEDSESDDGLEPLPFPEPDEPIPDMQDIENNDEFVLDPTTGKIAGVEYVDKPVVIKEEPQPLPPTTNELENIVKMAAADLSDGDLHNSDSQDDPLFCSSKEVKPVPPKPIPKRTEVSTPVMRKVVKYSVAGASNRSENSILNKSLTQGVQKPTLSSGTKMTPPGQRRVVQPQKVINQMVAQRLPGQQTRTVVRHVIEPTRLSTGSNINVIRKTITATPKSKFNLAPQKPMGSPIQPTRTYSAMGGIRQTNAAGSGSKVQVYSAKSNVSASQTVQPAIRRIGNTVVRSASSNQLTTVRRQQPVQQNVTQKQPVTRIVQRVVASPKKAVSQQILNNSPSKAQHKPVTSSKSKTVINMPSLTEDDTPLSPSKLQQKPQPAPQPAVQKAAPKLATPPVVKQEPILKVEEPVAEEPTPEADATESSAGADQTDWSSFTMADGDNPIYVTGDDGTIYQVAGQNEQGQTILITQGADGQQQCLLVTNEIGEMAPDEPQPSTSTANLATEAVTAENVTDTGVEEAQESELVVPTTIATSVDESLQTPLEIKTDVCEMEGIEDGVQDQVVAQVVRAEPPSPGGTHKVVVMLPDGNLMVTQVSPEEYASLELE